uniref:Uncharacterized protein n=1 Tax=Setaria italica TaxID=4555 RepID=K3YNS7_SETIT
MTSNVFDHQFYAKKKKSTDLGSDLEVLQPPG